MNKIRYLEFCALHNMAGCKHCQQHFQRKQRVNTKHWNLHLPDLVGGMPGSDAAVGLGSNCFGGFESEEKRVLSLVSPLSCECDNTNYAQFS